MDNDDDFERRWPPGTAKLQALHRKELGAKQASSIILQPRPTKDPNDPLNWPRWQKNINFGLACFYAMMVFAFFNATSPTWGPLADELNFSDATLTNTYAIGCATLALGAPMLIPFALKFGSRSVYTVSSVLQCAIAIWSANTRSEADWWGVNATQCWLGALCEVLVQMTIAEVFFVHQRGQMNSIYIWVQFVGSNLGVVASGFATLNMGWRWVWWLFAIFFGVQFLMFLGGFEETKFLQLDTIVGREERRASIIQEMAHGEKGRTGSGNDIAEPRRHSRSAELHGHPEDSIVDELTLRRLSTVNLDPSIPRKCYWQRMTFMTTSPGPWHDFLRHSWQPFMILFTIPGVAFAAAIYGITTAINTVMTATYSTIMIDEPYSFDAAQIGLMSLAPFIGSTIGTIIVGPVSDYTALQLSKRNDGIYEPEMRFWVFLPFIPFQIAGSWWYAYALHNGAPWIQVAVAYAAANLGAAPLMSLTLTYLLDAYNEIVGDSLTAVTIVRNTFSTIFVFAMPAWIARSGITNVFNALNAIGLVIFSFAGVFIWKGKYFRYRYAKAYRYYASRQFEARPI